MSGHVVSWTLCVPCELWTHNHERTVHWSRRAELTKRLRHSVATLAWASSMPKPVGGPVRIEVRPYQRRGRLADAAAHQPAAKAALDGLVDAGVIVDDSAPHVRLVEYHAPQRALDTSDALMLTITLLNADGPRGAP